MAYEESEKMAYEESEKIVKVKNLIDTLLDSRTYDMLGKVKSEIKQMLQKDLNNNELNTEEYSILMEYLDSEVNKLYNKKDDKSKVESTKVKNEVESTKVKNEVESTKIENEKEKIDFREEFRKKVLAKISEKDKELFAVNKRKQNEEDKKKEINILIEKEKRQDLSRMARKSDAYNGTMINITPKEEKVKSKGEER